MPLPQVTRAKLAEVFKQPETLRAFELLLRSLETTPEDVPAAQAAAEAAQAAADAAQANVDAIEAAAFVTVGAEVALPNERRLAVDTKDFALADGGAGNALTLSSADLVAILPANVSDTTAAFVDATGLAITLVANATYLVDALITFESAATTTGMALTFTLPAGATISGAYLHNSTTNAFQGSFNNASGAVGGNSANVAAATTDLALSGRWLIKTAATAGVAQLQFRTEIAASAITLKAGLSALQARRIA